MKKKPAFDYKAAGLDEKAIDEIFTKRRCDVMVARIPTAHIELTPTEWKEFLKRYPPKKKTRAAGPFDSIIRHLTALIGNKHLSEDHRRKYADDREYYRVQQKENRERNQLKGKKMFHEWIKRDEVFDLVDYIHRTRKGSATLAKCFDLAAQVWNAKRNGSITTRTVKTLYWNALNSNRKPYLSENP